MAKNNNKKSSPVGMLVLTIIFAIAFVLVLATNAGVLFGQPKDLYDVIEENGEPVKGEYVKLDMNATFGWYAEEEYKINGIIPAGKRYHYVARLDDGSVISVTFRGNKMKDKFDKILSNTEAYYMSGDAGLLKDTVTVKGKLTTVAGEQGTYYSDFLTGYYDGNIYRFSIDTTSKGTMFIVVIILAAIEVGCIIGFMGALKNKKKENEAPVQTADLEQ